MKAANRIALGVTGFLLTFASAGILAESGVFQRLTPDKLFDWPYAAIGTPLFIVGVWMAHKAGYRALRPFRQN